MSEVSVQNLEYGSYAVLITPTLDKQLNVSSLGRKNLICAFGPQTCMQSETYDKSSEELVF